MIKVIEPGTKKIMYCEECGCKFSYEKEDVHITPVSFYGNNRGFKNSVICPQCHKELVVEQTR